jgi:hypothetical protein
MVRLCGRGALTLVAPITKNESSKGIVCVYMVAVA